MLPGLVKRKDSSTSPATQPEEAEADEDDEDEVGANGEWDEEGWGGNEPCEKKMAERENVEEEGMEAHDGGGWDEEEWGDGDGDEAGEAGFRLCHLGGSPELCSTAVKRNSNLPAKQNEKFIHQLVSHLLLHLMVPFSSDPIVRTPTPTQ